ncbi:phosphotransferase [Phytoactinopolyspora halotolerans]|nr:phosphotransferase [Phytoactinopolyspora halotolerans]
MGRILRELTQAVEDFVPPADPVWRTEPVSGSTSMRHGDVGPWNTIWKGDRLVGLVDWDFAEPAPPLWDLAQAAWYGVPIFGGENRHRECGFDTEPDLRHRLKVLCGAYGADAETVLDALRDLQAVEQERVVSLSAQGIHPFTVFAARGDVEDLDAEAAELAALRGPDGPFGGL